MNRLNNSGIIWGFAIILFQLLPGCASKIPSSLPLPQNEKPFVLEQLQKFQDSKWCKSFDADVTLEWQMYGTTEKIPGILQLQSPSFLRYSVVDPMGRQLMILASDGIQFTLVNNREAKAITGTVGSKFWQGYIPNFIFPEDYLAWITGRLPEFFFQVEEIRRDKESADAVWLITNWQNSMRHHVLFFPGSGLISRHIVEDEKHDVLFDIMYSNYEKDEYPYKIPHLLKIQGTKVSGDVTLHIDEIFPESNIPEKFFHLSLPDHFDVQSVE